MAQRNNPVMGDWVSEVSALIKDLSLTFEEIESMKKSDYELLISNYINKKAVLNLKKKIKSKGKEIIYGDLKAQNYLLPNNILTLEEQREIFRYRTRMNKLKCNFSNKYIDFCQCKSALNNEHLYKCNVLNSEVKKYEYNSLFNGTIKEQKYIVNILIRNTIKHEEFTLAQD